MGAALAEGLTVFVKRDCPTCELVVPALADIQAALGLTVITQDDPAFPAELDGVVHDDDLSRSWHNRVETVPTLVRIADGVEVERIVGWSREEWQRFSGLGALGADLPDHRPGCGSMSVDPDITDELAARFEADRLSSRRVEFAELEDEFEAMFDRGWSDGLPLVPPTEARVRRMLAGTSRDRTDVVAVVPPNLVEVTVEKAAVNAVMAGCRPEYLPVVLSAIEAVCTDEFNMHGVLATTMGVGPVLIVNGPIRHEIGMNSGMNVLGQGTRANSTIGRALQLIIRNVGGGRPGEIDRATHGSPAKLGFCFAEDEEGSPWTSLAVERGFREGTDTVTAFTGEAPRIIFDQLSRTPEALTESIAESMLATVAPRVTGMDCVLILSPEHIARYADAGWTKARFTATLFEHLQLDYDFARPGVEPKPGVAPTIPKFDPDGGILIVHAGGPAGLFSSVIGGWVSGEKGSVPITKEIMR